MKQNNESYNLKLAFVVSITALFAPNLLAASFDCSKRLSSIEKMICANDVLSVLDQQLSETYIKAIENTADKGDLKNRQIEWLKQRNKCSSTDCLVDIYRSRIQELETVQLRKEGVAASSIAGARFYLKNGKQYEVCRVFNNYLNSAYYREGDCFVGDYPDDRRLRGAVVHPVNVEKYRKQYVELLRKGAPLDSKEQRMKTDNKIIDEGQMLFWEVDVDLNNDKTSDSFLVVALLGQKDAKTNRCTDFTSKNIVHLNTGRFSGKWGGIIRSSTPFIFDGKTFIAYGNSSYDFSIAEPSSNENEGASTRTLQKTFICDFKNLNYRSNSP